jgi:triosephosphate isomerase
MRKLFIAGNWKMNLNRKESLALAKDLAAELGSVRAVDLAVCPPFVYLEAVGGAIAGSTLRLGAQNLYFQPPGAYTGEVAASMLKDVGCTYVIVGHSERRHILKETDELVSSKVRAALACGLRPILCVGELLEEREAAKTEAVVRRQVEAGLADVPAADLGRVTIAYEPVWAIGTGRNATPKQAGEVHAFIREVITGLYDKGAAQGLTIQYGGSVKPENAEELLAEEEIDGALVGGASLKVDSFVGIVRAGLTVKGAPLERRPVG